MTSDKLREGVMTEAATGVMKRVSPSRAAEREVWAKAAGRCTLCARYLFGETPSYASVAVGQVAHQVGAMDGPKSPRGDSELTDVQRSEPSNLMLLCQPCHRLIDEEPDDYPVEWLARQKNEFETRVREATRFPTLEPTGVVIFTAPIRGNVVTISKPQVFEALQGANLWFASDHHRDSNVEIYLTLPETALGAWAAGQSQIHHALQQVPRLMTDVLAESMSIFALGPIPYLIALGSEIGNKTAVHVFEPHRSDGRTRWRWPTTAEPPRQFVFDVSERDANVEDVLVTVSITADVQVDRLPEDVAATPRVKLRIVGDHKPGAIDSEVSLANFADAWRQLLQNVEAMYPSVRRLHVVAAVGCSAAVELGRARMRDAHPEFVVYQLTGGTDPRYEQALTIG
jgi:hypothetical protein